MTAEEVAALSMANQNDFGMTPEEIKRRQKLVEAVAKYDTELARTIASGPYRINTQTKEGSASEAWRRGPVTRGDTGGVSLSDQLRSTGQGVAGVGPPPQPAYNPLPQNQPSTPAAAPGSLAPGSLAPGQQGPKTAPTSPTVPSMSGPVPSVSGTIPSEYNYPQNVPGGNNAWFGTTNSGQPMAGPRDQWGFVQPQQQTFMPSISNGNFTQPSDYNYPQNVPGGNNAWFGTTNNGQPMAGPRDQWGFSQPEGGQANKGRYSPQPMGNGTPTGMENFMPVAPQWGAPMNPQNMLPQWQQAFIGAPQQGPQPYQAADIWRGAPPGFMGDARWRMMR